VVGVNHRRNTGHVRPTAEPSRWPLPRDETVKELRTRRSCAGVTCRERRHRGTAGQTRCIARGPTGGRPREHPRRRSRTPAQVQEVAAASAPGWRPRTCGSAHNGPPPRPGPAGRTCRSNRASPRRTRHTRRMGSIAVRRVNFGYFVRPADGTEIGQPRLEPAWAIWLFTRWANCWSTPAWKRIPPSTRTTARAATWPPHSRGPVRHRGRADGGQLPAAPRPRRQQFRLPCRPILTQRVKLEAARRADYTLPELIEAPGLRYEPLDGEAEIRPWRPRISTPVTPPATSHGSSAATTAPSSRLHRATTRTPPTPGLARSARRARGVAATDACVDRPARTLRPRPGGLRLRPRRLGALTRATSPRWRSASSRCGPESTTRR